MCQVFFKDGKPLECPNVTLNELRTLFRICMIANARIQCHFHYGRGLILLDLHEIDARKTFGDKFPVDAAKLAA